MLTMLWSVVVVVVVVAVALGLAAVALVAPFVLAVDMAERRGFSTFRWGAVHLVCVALGGGVFLVGESYGHVLWIITLVMLGITPGLLSLLTKDEQLVGGVQGLHES